MAYFKIFRGTQAEVDAQAIVDGQLLYTTDLGTDNKIYADVVSTRTTLANGVGVDLTDFEALETIVNGHTTDISDLNNRVSEVENNKADKSEVANVMTPKGNIAYASLPTTGNEVGWYYYCPDGDGTNGAGNYVWNGTAWFFGGTGDEGYNILKSDLDTLSNEYYSNIYKQIIWSDYTNTNYRIIFPKKIYANDKVKLKLTALTGGWIDGYFSNGNTRTSLGFASRNMAIGETIVVEGLAPSLIDNFWIISSSTIKCDVWVYCDSWSITGKVGTNKNSIDNLWSGLVDSAKYKMQAFSVEASDYSSNTVILNNRRIKSGHTIKLRVVAYGTSYLKAVLRLATTEGNISVSSGYTKYGEVLTVEGVASTDFDNLMIYSTASVPCDVYIYNNDWNDREIIVDKNGFGDYTSIDEAIKNAKDTKDNPVTIRVRAGIYETETETPTNIPYVKTNRYLSIVGDDVNNCIIRNDNGYYSPYTPDSGGLLYDSSTIRISGNVTIENLTIISTDENYGAWVASESGVQGVERAQSYCVHTDFDCDENTTTLIKNCKMVNDHYSCVGAGNRKNHKIQVENCELQSTTDYAINPATIDGAPIFIHSYNLNSENAYEGQEIVVKNNILINTNATRSCYFYASSPDRLYATLIGNVSKTINTQGGFVSYGDAYGVTKTDLCFGNNITTMNN